jgi:hypothetical protein
MAIINCKFPLLFYSLFSNLMTLYLLLKHFTQPVNISHVLDQRNQGGQKALNNGLR